MDGFGDVLLFALMDAYRLNEIMIGQLIAILSIIYATPWAIKYGVVLCRAIEAIKSSSTKLFVVHEVNNM